MSIYDRTYRSYDGSWTPTWSRFLVIPRFALRELFSSKLFLALFVASLVWPVAASLIIYLRHNAGALSMLDLPVEQIIAIDARFFGIYFLGVQARFAVLLALVVGPALISPDLRNNGLPLILSRPFGRADYVLGKFTVVALLLSAVTWMPGLLLFAEQAYLEEGWLAANGWIAGSIFAGSWAWITVLTLLALALSAWVKWKPLARLLFLGVFFLLEGLGRLVSALWETHWGGLLQLSEIGISIWSNLFRLQGESDLPPAAAWAALTGLCVLCLVLLSRKLEAYEVVR